MNKVVYSFWTEPLKHKWASYADVIDLDKVVKYSINCLYLSVLYAKKHGFEIEIFTDQESKHYFDKLPYDNLSTDLSFLSYHQTWIEGKLLAISRQNTPFVYIDWDVILLKPEVANIIKNFKTDILVQNVETVINTYDQEYQETKITIDQLFNFQHHTDFSNFYVSNFHRVYDSYYNTSVIGFNNLEVKDQYISDIKKCLSITRNKNLQNASKIIDQYVIYTTAKYMRATHSSIIEDIDKVQETAKKIGYTHLTHLNKFSQNTQNKIKKKIKTEFPEYKFLIGKKLIRQKIKISLCTVVMNRFDHFITTLKHNIKVVSTYKGTVDINILDYNSTDGLEDYLFKQSWFLAAVENELVHYYKNFDAKYYHRTLPKNKIHTLSKGAYLINIDADNFVSTPYLDYCLDLIHNETNFFLRPSINNSQGTFGRVMIKKTDFEKIGGYNLTIENYGFEDTEITLRLRKSGVRQLEVSNNLKLNFIKHSDELRIANEKPIVAHNDYKHNVYKSDYDNRNFELELYPNLGKRIQLELYVLDSKRNKIKVM